MNDLSNDLNKAIKIDQVQSMLPTHTPEQHKDIHETVKAASALGGDAAGNWYLHNVSKSPDLHDKHKETIKNYGNLVKQVPELKKVPFSKNLSLEDGLSHMKTHIDNHSQERISKDHLYSMKGFPNAKKVLDVGNGFAWHNLGKTSSNYYGGKMGHCGNDHSVDSGDTIYSLDKKVKLPNGKVGYQPHLTFINNDGNLGEMKGRGNTKPAKKYHHAIKELLKHPSVNHVLGGGFQDDNNFHLGDLSPEHKAEVQAIKPKIDLTDSNNVQELEDNLSYVEDKQRYNRDPKLDYVADRLKTKKDLLDTYGDDFHSQVMDGLLREGVGENEAAHYFSFLNKTPENLEYLKNNSKSIDVHNYLNSMAKQKLNL